MPQDFIWLQEPELTLAKSCQVRLSATANKVDFEVVGREIRGCLARKEGSALSGKIRRVLSASHGAANIHDAAVAIAIVHIFNRMHYNGIFQSVQRQSALSGSATHDAKRISALRRRARSNAGFAARNGSDQAYTFA
jgi:hypothetical protein